MVGKAQCLGGSRRAVALETGTSKGTSVKDEGREGYGPTEGIGGFPSSVGQRVKG